MTNKVFKDIPKQLLIQDKVEIMVKRYENNYFLDKDLESIDDNLDEYVRPVSKVTKNLLDSCIPRDIRAKSKKIHWVLNSQEDFASDFKENLRKNNYKSLNEVFKESSLIYSMYCDNYNEAKATVSSENGKKVYKRKQANGFCEEFFNSENNYNGNDCDSVKDTIIALFINNFDKLQEIFNMSNEELKSKLTVENDSLNLLTSITGLKMPTRERDCLLYLSSSFFLDLLKNS